jgi:hypothetical protein
MVTDRKLSNQGRRSQLTALEPHFLAMLELVLSDDYVQHLPPLLNKTKPGDQQDRKNTSRAFSAFAIRQICDIPIVDAAKSVVDDFDDFGIDAIYYHATSETVYLVQGKLKASEQFSQVEALAFCQGVRKLIKQDLSGFNKNVQDRLVELEDVFENCKEIQLVVAHTGSGISSHAKTVVEDLLKDEDHGEERFRTKVLDYDAARVVRDLQIAKSYGRVDAEIWLQKCETIQEPRVTYFGLMELEELVKLHCKHGKALYEKNIRTFLGHKTGVNTAIRRTLAESPEDFLYLNNGVAALCEQIEPKGINASRGGRKKLKIRGLSVINGAQTIASAARFLEESAESDISKARVSVTLIKTAAEGDFGKAVTRARNHQNPISLSNFVALDDEQERLRRDLAYLGISYVYKAEAMDNKADPLRIQIDEAAQALALFQADPRFVVWLKKEPARLLDTAGEQYKSLFPTVLTPFQLANAVRFLRYVQGRMFTESKAAGGKERLAYKHGNHVIGWVLAQRVRDARNSAQLVDEEKLKVALSNPIDALRQMLWTETQKITVDKGPLALFRNQTDVLPLLVTLLTDDYGLTTDPVVGHKKGQQKTGQPYPLDLFAYLISKAPQIGNLT